MSTHNTTDGKPHPMPLWSGVHLCPWCKNILIRECDVLVCRNIAWHYGSVMFMQNDQEAKPDVR